jgi:hypothetical protein
MAQVVECLLSKEQGPEFKSQYHKKKKKKKNCRIGNLLGYNIKKLGEYTMCTN